MKTTNYEISKKLKEIGFKGEAEYFWVKRHGFVEPILLHISLIKGVDKKLARAFDLETILDALPEIIELGSKSYHFWLEHNAVGYYEPNFHNNLVTINLAVSDNVFRISNAFNNESLADTAARLLVKLCEEGIIKFDKK